MKDNIIDLKIIEDQTSKKLSQGFRATFSLIAKEIAKTNTELTTITDSKGEELIHFLCNGASEKELKKLINNVEGAGNWMLKLSEALKREFSVIFPSSVLDPAEKDRPEDTEDDMRERFDESYRERFHKGGYIVIEMLNDYQQHLNCEIENGIRMQLSGQKKSKS